MNKQNIITIFLPPLFAIFSFFCFSSCDQEDGNHPQLPDYTEVTKIAVLDIETGQVHLLADGIFPKIAPNSDIIFYSSRNGLSSINIDSTDAKLLINSFSYVINYSFPQFGSKVVIRLIESTGDNNYTNNMYTMNLDGSQRTKILNYTPPTDPTPAFSPQMDKIVFTNGRELVSIDPNGGNYKVLKPKSDTVYYYNTKFLPDNDRIIFVEVHQDKYGNTISKTVKVLSLSKNTEVVIGNYDPQFEFNVSDDGKILMVNLAGDWRASIIDANNNFQVSDVLYGYPWNSLSKDGKKLVSTNLYSIHIMNIDGTDFKTLYTTKNDSTQVTDPMLSKDGKHVVFKYLYIVPK